MPAGQRRRLHDDQGLAPITLTCQDSQRDTGGVGGTSRSDAALLIQRELFAQKKVFRGKRGAWVQAEEEITHSVSEERRQRASKLEQVTAQTGNSCHGQGSPPWRGLSSLTNFVTGRAIVQSRVALSSIPPLPPGEGGVRARQGQGERLRLETAIR
jgi:hypothetical protein